jgi:hypothetical protein
MSTPKMIDYLASISGIEVRWKENRYGYEGFLQHGSAATLQAVLHQMPKYM